MSRYALLLRGVNVGAKNSLPMAELRAMLTKIGCTEVSTYVQSGNAVLSTKLAAAELEQAIETALARYMGRAIATTVQRVRSYAAGASPNPCDSSPKSFAATRTTWSCAPFRAGAGAIFAQSRSNTPTASTAASAAAPSPAAACTT